MKTKLIKVGNSQGVRIPRLLIEEAGLTGELEMSVEGDALVLRTARHPRAGWVEAIAALGPDDIGSDDLPVSDVDEEEWKWE
jgi:antitoxin MazE